MNASAGTDTIASAMHAAIVNIRRRGMASASVAVINSGMVASTGRLV